MKEDKITYYLICGRVLGKRENDKDYLFNGRDWVPDKKLEILRRLFGFDPSEPEDSPYAVGNTDIMEELEEISEERAFGLMSTAQKVKCLYEKWKVQFEPKKAKWDRAPGWPSKFVETRFELNGEEWSVFPTDIGLTMDGWDQGFMETIQAEMESDLKKLGATKVASYGFID